MSWEEDMLRHRRKELLFEDKRLNAEHQGEHGEYYDSIERRYAINKHGLSRKDRLAKIWGIEEFTPAERRHMQEHLEWKIELRKNAMEIRRITGEHE